MSKSEAVRVGRKRFYLHEAYQGSGLQNNGRKQVHGTFPCERACVPLIQGLVAPRRPAVNRDVTLWRIVWTGLRTNGQGGWRFQREGGGGRTFHAIQNNLFRCQSSQAPPLTFTVSLLIQRGSQLPAYLFQFSALFLNIKCDRQKAVLRHCALLYSRAHSEVAEQQLEPDSVLKIRGITD